MTVCYAGKSRPSALLLGEVDPDLAVVRSSNGDINWGRARANTSLNPDISFVTNKRVMRGLFRDHDIPMPRLLTLEEARIAVARGYTIIGRPDRHTKGRGFWRCSSPLALRRALRGTRRKKAATHFMEYVIAPREYRVHVFKGKSIRISEKLFGDTGPTSMGSYTTIKPQHNIKHVRKAAKQAVAAVGLDFGCVDVLANDDECWILEVNAAPHLGGSLAKLYADTFRRWQEGEFDG